MTITISDTGHVMIPQAMREHQGFRSGDALEVEEAPGKVILSKASKLGKQGLVERLLSCPHFFEVPPRDPNDTVGAK